MDPIETNRSNLLEVLDFIFNFDDRSNYLRELRLISTRAVKKGTEITLYDAALALLMPKVHLSKTEQELILIKDCFKKLWNDGRLEIELDPFLETGLRAVETFFKNFQERFKANDGYRLHQKTELREAIIWSAEEMTKITATNLRAILVERPCPPKEAVPQMSVV